MFQHISDGMRADRGHAVAQLVEALHYKPKVSGSIPDGVIGIFIDIIHPATL